MKHEIAKQYIDIAAGEARNRYISTGVGQEATYLIKSQQAKEYAAAGYTGTVPIFIAAEALATNTTPQVAADVIIATETQWFMLASEIEKLRRTAKIHIDTLTDGNEISQYCETVINQFNAM